MTRRICGLDRMRGCLESCLIVWLLPSSDDINSFGEQQGDKELAVMAVVVVVVVMACHFFPIRARRAIKALPLPLPEQEKRGKGVFSARLQSKSVS